MIKELVRQSRSYRTFDETRNITETELRELVECARLCPSAINRQPLKYKLISDKEEVESVLSLTKWGGMLPNLKLPPDGKHPTACIVVTYDNTLSANEELTRFDAGTASQTIMLSAAEKGLGGCIIGAFDKRAVASMFDFSDNIVPIVILALGKPNEAVVLCEADNGNTAYYRDEANVHFVPKRKMEDIIL